MNQKAMRGARAKLSDLSAVQEVRTADGFKAHCAGAWFPARGTGAEGGGSLVRLTGVDGRKSVTVGTVKSNGDKQWWSVMDPDVAEEMGLLLIMAAAKARRNA